MYSWFIAFAIYIGFTGILSIIIGFIISLYNIFQHLLRRLRGGTRLHNYLGGLPLYYKIKDGDPMNFLTGWNIFWAIVILFSIGLGWFTQNNVNIIRYPETEYNIVKLAEALNISPNDITYREGIDCAYIENHQLFGTDDYTIVYPKNTNTVNAEDFRYDKADT